MKAKAPVSNVEWKAWARRDPLYAVATCPGKDKAGADPWTSGDFYALGESDWEDFYERWSRYHLDRRSCAEIGCGAGRITRMLARDFEVVHALDVSEEMLHYARKHVPRPNVRFHLTDGAEIPLPDHSVTAVFSCHVFQHFDSLETGRTYFREIERVLVDGGTLMIHLPVHCWPHAALSFELIHRARKTVSDLKAAWNRRLINAGVFRPLMRRLTYPLEWFHGELPALGFGEIEIAVIAPRSSRDPHPFVLAQKGNHPRREVQRTISTRGFPQPVSPVLELRPG